MAVDVGDVARRLGLAPEFRPWLEELDSIQLPDEGARLPDLAEAESQLSRLGVEPVDAREILATLPDPRRERELWWLLERCHAQLVALMGVPSLPWGQPALRLLPEHLGVVGRLFYVYVFLAALPDVRRYHAARGIPDDTSWTTLADLGEHLAIYRAIFGTAGLDVPWWLTLHFRGVIYRLGRLQFNRGSLPPDWEVAAGPGKRPMAGTPMLDLHIPESGGPLRPSACDESFHRATNFFARYFPEESYRFGRCSSWLLDDQLAEYLPETSNIVRFQRRFHLVPHSSETDSGVIRFVFRRGDAALDELPQGTQLERAIVTHLRAGRHWLLRSGWLEL